MHVDEPRKLRLGEKDDWRMIYNDYERKRGSRNLLGRGTKDPILSL